MNEMLIMTPGPTAVAENVRLARAQITTNPDLDLDFYDFYKQSTEKFQKFLKTKNDVRILAGEGILGLEAAVASLTEVGDRVLVIDNGVFGAGFADFVTMYGGEAVVYSAKRTSGLDLNDLADFLKDNHDFKYATLVHCDTPSGVLNDISKVCPLLKSYGILTLVDSVAAMGGEELLVDDWQIDIVCGGSQKVISAPAGLTIVSISEAAYQAMENRKLPIASFYANLLVFKDYYEKKWFPYTMPISDIHGLDVAIDNLLADKAILDCHAKIAAATRVAVEEAGLQLYLESGYSSTVTVIQVPENINSADVLELMKKDYQVMIAGSFDYLAGKVFRMGHMGENARPQKVARALYALQRSLEHYGVIFKGQMQDIFYENLK